MRLLYIVEQERDETLRRIEVEQKKRHEIEIIQLSENPDYESIMEKIESSDRLISW